MSFPLRIMVYPNATAPFTVGPANPVTPLNRTNSDLTEHARKWLTARYSDLAGFSDNDLEMIVLGGLLKLALGETEDAPFVLTEADARASIVQVVRFGG